ncbi:hypothetical protein CASbig_37 [Mycobacterium phage CASbig]|uniref:site-specific recombination directionality factor RDF n=1 Tax=Mycobacterium phage CASbig TaxID=1327035 RepID=UPI00032B38FE|nr:site-specific recombination directionality factor RDF [Mycobacterium phage CASbig]AGK88085.1 hypothetical protein CASbig_37 [Mycobacterium phage CASbig]
MSRLRSSRSWEASSPLTAGSGKSDAVALTRNGNVLPYLHFEARSREIPRVELIEVLVEETYAKRSLEPVNG